MHFRRDQANRPSRGHAPRKSLVRGVSIVLLHLVWAQAAGAETFSNTNVQLLSGTGFHDPFYDTNTESGAMSTITLEHFGAWNYGYNYFFVDMYHGDFIPSDADQSTRIYAEWETQLSLGKTFRDSRAFGPLKDIYLAAQIDRSGQGFYATLLGGGFYADVGKHVLGMGAYFRKDKFNSLTFQFTPFWSFGFSFDSVAFVFAGYADFIGTDDVGLDLNAQPQLMLDLGRLVGWRERNVLLGAEWFFHRNDQVTTSALQGLFIWSW